MRGSSFSLVCDCFALRHEPFQAPVLPLFTCYSPTQRPRMTGKRLQYYQRVFSAYLLPGKSQLTFWHDKPAINKRIQTTALGPYYMDFFSKADYAGIHDANGIPMLDYHGEIGPQYNPIAIAQWGLGNYNRLCETGNSQRGQKVLAAADWLYERLEKNAHGVFVWHHEFDWEYRTPLKAPWYSGLAQGQGISLLVRAFQQTGEKKYLDAADCAFMSFLTPMSEGGVTLTDDRGDTWFEEYIVSPPTHILNGFIWAAWGVYDYFLARGNSEAQMLFEKAVVTLRNNLTRYDLGFWSLYEQSGTLLPMVASPFYHRLHIVQLRVMHRLTGEQIFAEYAARWYGYIQSRMNRGRALCYKSAFKLAYY
jgi:heparosan-N-sulfate-glucuronate 5-epimerase